ncbi:MAG: hypothetical protein ACRCXZ_05185 [Patescibacteria group bacterium]
MNFRLNMIGQIVIVVIMTILIWFSAVFLPLELINAATWWAPPLALGQGIVKVFGLPIGVVVGFWFYKSALKKRKYLLQKARGDLYRGNLSETKLELLNSLPLKDFADISIGEIDSAFESSNDVCSMIDYLPSSTSISKKLTN